jgi:hypothetical protein
VRGLVNAFGVDQVTSVAALGNRSYLATNKDVSKMCSASGYGKSALRNILLVFELMPLAPAAVYSRWLFARVSQVTLAHGACRPRG